MSINIVRATRTAIGSYLGSLKGFPPEVLFSIVLKRLGVDVLSSTDELIVGSALSNCPNLSRVSLLLAGFPEKTPAYTVNHLCASGLQAVINAIQSIKCGDSQVVIAGGVDSLSRAPYYFSPEARYLGFARMNREVIDSFEYASCNAQPSSLYPDTNMGITAENIAKKYGINRETQDEYAYYSQMKYKDALETGLFVNEICPVSIENKGIISEFMTDEHPRPQTTVESLSKLKPCFLENGTVTAGNSTGLNDGASAILLMSETAVKNESVFPLASVVTYSAVGCDPRLMGLGIVPAVRSALKKAGLAPADIDYYEISEAFAAQIIGCLIELEFYGNKEMMSRINVNGGMIAQGHALANSGTKMITSLVYQLRRTQKKYGLVAMCVGGGQGVAIIVENLYC